MPWVNISGATAATYTVQSGDLGDQVRCAVTATNTVGSATVDSVPTQIVTSGTQAPINTVVPVVTGSVATGQVLTVSDGVWTGAPAPTFTRQWQRSLDNAATWSNIASATASTYTVQEADVGALLRCSVTASNSAGNATVPSAGVGPAIESSPTNKTAPVINGIAQEGTTLTVSNGVWTAFPDPTYSYVWQVSLDGTTWTTATGIGALTNTYAPAHVDVGSFLRCQVSATNSAGFGNAFSATTAAVLAIATPQPITPPDILDTPPVPTANVAIKTLIFEETFSGPLNTSIWSLSWFNGAIQDGVVTDAANVAVVAGNLEITLSVSGVRGASVNTNPVDGGKTGFTYTVGYVEARIKFPAVALTNGDLGTTAFWTTGQTWPNTGELDIVEIGTTPQGFYDNYHSGGPSKDGTNHVDNNGPVAGPWADGNFHTFGVNRRVGFADIYWDGAFVRTITTFDSEAPHYIVANIAGVGPAGTKVVIDYIRVWSTP